MLWMFCMDILILGEVMVGFLGSDLGGIGSCVG